MALLFHNSIVPWQGQNDEPSQSHSHIQSLTWPHRKQRIPVQTSAGISFVTFPATGLTCCINHLSHCCDKGPDKGNLRKEGRNGLAHSFKGFSPSWPQKQETSAHTSSALRKQKVVDACAQLTLSVLFTWEPALLYQLI